MLVFLVLGIVASGISILLYKELKKEKENFVNKAKSNKVFL